MDNKSELKTRSFLPKDSFCCEANLILHQDEALLKKGNWLRETLGVHRIMQ